MSTATIVLALAMAPTGDHQPGWDDDTVAAPLEPAPVSEPASEPPPPQPDAETTTRYREGKGLLIGAGVTAGVGLVANIARIYVVTRPCQTDAQAGCTGWWGLTTAVAWGTNAASIALAGVGANLRGRYDATYDPQGHRRRARGATVAGAVLLGTGALAAVLLRIAWFSDYVNPGGRELFDFAKPGQAIAYYGGTQASSMMMAAGIGMLTYGGARPYRRKLAITPTGMGMQLRGWF